MDQGQYTQMLFAQGVSSVWLDIIGVLPQIAAALLVLIIGWSVAKWARWVVIKLLRAIGIEKVLKDSPVEQFLERAEVATKAEQLVGDTVRWLVIFVFIITAANILDLDAVSELLTGILSYIPDVVAAVVLLVLGTMLAGVAESLVKGAFANISVAIAKIASRVTSYVIMIFTVLGAIAQLGIAENLIYILFVGFVAMLALGFGLAFGLGSKDLISEVLKDWYKDFKSQN